MGASPPMEPRPSTAALVAVSAAADSQPKADMTDWADELRVQREHSSDPIVDPWDAASPDDGTA